MGGKNNKMSDLILRTFRFRQCLSARNYSIIGFLSLRKFTFLECHRRNNAKIGIALYVLYIVDVLYYHGSINKGDDKGKTVYTFTSLSAIVNRKYRRQKCANY